MKKLILLVLLCGIAGTISSFSQKNPLWLANGSSNLKSLKSTAIQKKTYQLDIDLLKQKLGNSPDRKNTFARNSHTTIEFPLPDGTTEHFKVVENSVLAPQLSKKFPDIKSYYGISLQNKKHQIRFSVDLFGFHGLLILSGKTYFINPTETRSGHYFIAQKSDFNAEYFECRTIDNHQVEGTDKNTTLGKTGSVDDGLLRTYRMALTCTGEYANFHIGQAGVSNGTDEEKKAAVLSAMNTTITRVNEIYERDLSIRLELIANNDQLIFLDPDTDPYTNDDGDTLIDEIGPAINDIISANDYDIGHVFSTGGGGLAQVASVCGNSKARGLTGTSNPVGDPFDVDYVAHEIGHQFGATHTFNNSCSSNRSDATAVEPGSGSTIMGYAGICPDNVQGYSDPFFHIVSIAQIWDNITEGFSTCATTSVTGNNAPTIDAGNNYVIPAGTAFVLEGTATDTDGDNLTYSWEQLDNQVVSQPPAANSTGGPAFRSWVPNDSPRRYFPRSSAILNNNLTPTWEVVSNKSRDYNFALMVRDNNPAGGQTARDNVRVTSIDKSGPFTVTSQNTSATVQEGDVLTINWNVANTNTAPINALNVNIYLIIDGDFEAMVPIRENAANDGEENVIIPSNSATNNARIMVKASNNIFFAINEATLTIESTPFSLNTPELTYNICQPDDVVFDLGYETFNGFSDNTTLSAANVPSGLTVNFNPSTVDTNNTTITTTISNTGAVASGVHIFNVVATSGSVTKTYPIQLNIYNNSFEAVTLQSPANGAVELPTTPTVSWSPVGNTSAYDIQFAEDAAFTTVVESAQTELTSYAPSSLQPSATYYWRVRPVNECGEGSYSGPFSFTTVAMDCISKANNSVVNITTQPNTVTSTINIPESGYIYSLALHLDITHSYIGDLTITLTSPTGTVIPIITEVCDSYNDINATFQDTGHAIFCDSEPNASLNDIIKPQGALTDLKGELVTGTWILTVTDNYTGDGGTINSFGLDICSRNDQDNDGVADAIDLCPNTPEGSKVDINGCPMFSLPASNYTVKTIDETCISNNDGSIVISATTPHSYIARLTGEGKNESASFTNTTEFNNLSSGNYTVCFTVEGEADYEQCFDLSINQPQSLSVFSSVLVNEQLLTLELKGGSVYNINLNGITTQTREDLIVLNLKKGNNILNVTANKECQGLYSENIFIPGEINAYPNPFSGTITLFTGEKHSDYELEIYATNGNLVYRMKGNSGDKGGVDLDLSSLSAGTYFVKIKKSNIISSYKIIKK